MTEQQAKVEYSVDPRMYAQQLVRDWPPLSEETRQRLAALLRFDSEPTGECSTAA